MVSGNLSDTNNRIHLDRPSRNTANIDDAQLALMDRVTREAIDERLRVLEGVSGQYSGA